MIRKFELLIPAFLKDIDRKLLLHSPALWATKVHYVIYFAALGLGLILLKVMLTGNMLTDPVSPKLHFGLLLIPAVAAFLLWAGRLTLFNVERNFGHTGPNQDMGIQLVYLFCISLIGLLPFAYGHLLSAKLAHSVDDRALADDINILNIGDMYLNSSQLDYRNSPDEFYSPYTYVGGVVGQESLFEKSKTRDREEALERIRAFIPTFEKYSGYQIQYSPETLYTFYENGLASGDPGLAFFEARHKVRKNIQKVADAKAGGYFFHNREFRQFSTVLIALLWLGLVLFLRAGWKPFLAAAFAGFVGMAAAGTFSGMADAFFNWDPQLSLSALFFGSLALLLIQAYSPRNTRRANFISTTALSLATVMVFFVPTFAFWAMDLNLDSNGPESLLTSLFLGAALAFVSWNTVINKRFLELQSTPRQN